HLRLFTRDDALEQQLHARGVLHPLDVVPRVRRTGSRGTVEPAAHRPLVTRLVVVAILTKRPVVLLAAQGAPRELAIAPAEQIDCPHQRRAAGSRDVLDESLVLV